MATSYLAPGVYVEEVPSAMQSIAGVGTNTLGFIGIVEDEISYPEYLSDDDYQDQLKKAYVELYGKDEDYSDAKVAAKLAAATQDQTAKATALTTANRNLTTAKGKTVAAKTAQSNLVADADAAAKTAAQQTVDTATATEATAQAAAITAKTEADDAQKALDNANVLSAKPEGDRIGTARSQARENARAKVQRYKLVPFKVDVAAGQAKLCTNFSEFQSRFGPWSAYANEQVASGNSDSVKLNGHQVLSHAMYGFFSNSGTRAFVARVRKDSIAADLDQALSNFESIESISLVAFPGQSADLSVSAALVAHCEKTRYRFAILDAPQKPLDENDRLDLELLTYDSSRSALPARSKHAAIYFPYIEVVDPALQMQQANLDAIPSKYKGLVYVPPSGAIAGIYSRTDNQRGVFKAPANESVLGARNVQYYIGRSAQEGLNPQGLNVIRSIEGAITVYGARTLGGDLNFEWRYVPVRRTFLYLAKSIDAGTQWVVFEPNDLALWGKVKRNLAAFLTTQWRNGALFGATPEEAFYVKCDAENNPPDTREVGQLVIEVGVAIVRPAEFVIIRMTQGTAKAT